MRRYRPFVVALSIAFAAPAQGPTFGRVHGMLPPNLSAGTVLQGDVDNDGHVDLVGLANTLDPGPKGFVWRGTGDGMTELPNALPHLVRNVVAARLADIDGDGDLDCLTLNAPVTPTPCVPPYGAGISNDVFWNDGTGHFSAAATPLPAPPLGRPNWTSLDVGDVDGDGDVDVIAGTAPYMCVPDPTMWWVVTLNLGEDHLYLNDGAGGFTLAVPHLPSFNDATADIVLADFDGDSDLDVFLGGHRFTGPSSSRLYRNTGTGMFAEVVGALPANTSMTWGGTAHARDFDGDGDLDLLLHRQHAFVNDNVRYLRNTGTGLFVDATASLPTLGPALCLVVGDWNGDARPDFAVTETQVKTLTNQGGSFVVTDTRDLPGELRTWDLEDDGDLDLVGMGFPHVIARNDGTGQWHTVPRDLPEAYDPVRALLDIDADGDLDGLTVFSSAAEPGRLLRNAGDGRFSLQPVGDFTLHHHHFDDLLVGDVDGDSAPDVLGITRVAISPFGFCRLYRNVAGTLQQVPFPALDAVCGALGDLDGDGDLDAYLGRAGQLDEVLLNDGVGQFTVLPGAVGIQTFGGFGGAVALTDVDGDGDLDAALAAGGFPSRVLRNAGPGTFTPSAFTASGFTEVKASDFDGDGDDDLIFGSYGAAQPDQLYRNNGLGSFTVDSGALPSPPRASQWIRCADVDGDGDIDIVRRLSYYQQVADHHHAEVLVNDGTGHFTAVALRDQGAWAFEVGDLDGDRDADVLLSYAHLRVHWNLLRQSTWRALPRIGRPLTLDLSGPPAQPYALGLAFAPANIPIPGLGRLRLDPASLLVVQLGTFAAAGSAVFTIMVPGIPSLTGLDVYWQALSGSVPILGNLEVATLQVH